MNLGETTTGRCCSCHFSLPLCICSTIPAIALRTRVCLVVHTRELRRSSNTGRLAMRVLLNSEMRVRGEGRDPLDLTDLLTDAYRTLLLFPSRDAVELNTELVAQEATPIQLIVPDGTWRQASKVRSRHRELKGIKHVMIRNTVHPRFYMRAQHRKEGMATLQAIALALGAIEGDFVKHQLLKLYHAKIAQALKGRGLSCLAAPLFNS